MAVPTEAITSKETPTGMTTATGTGTPNDPHAATLATLARVCGAGAYDTARFRDNLRLFVPRERLLEVLGVLKGECGFALLAELGFDSHERPERLAPVDFVRLSAALTTRAGGATAANRS